MKTLESKKRNALWLLERQKKKPSPFEVIVCDMLTKHNIEFEHQYLFFEQDKYWIADFFLPKHRLILEIDGAGHFQDKAAANDREKELRMIKGYGYSVVRFNNEQAANEPNLIIDFIVNHVPTNAAFYDNRVPPVYKSLQDGYAGWNAIPQTGVKDGQIKNFLSITQALNYYKIPQSQYTMYFRNNPNASTYISKTGVTLTKTTLI